MSMDDEGGRTARGISLAEVHLVHLTATTMEWSIADNTSFSFSTRPKRGALIPSPPIRTVAREKLNYQRTKKIIYFISFLSLFELIPTIPCYIRHLLATPFQDLGGYAAAGGKKVKQGVVYRSDQLSGVSLQLAAEVLVGKLHIHHTYDLRGPAEAQAQMYQFPNIERHAVPIDCANVIVAVRELRDMSFEEAKDWMRKCYVYLVDECHATTGAVLKDLLRLRVDSINAALVHCTAGKDRTGIVCYLILALLGVDEETIVKDYLLTNDLVLAHEPTLATQRTTAAAFNLVDEAYIRLAITMIKDKYGGVEKYALDRLALTPSEIQAFRELLLEDA
eukprot:gene10621-7381_t